MKARADTGSVVDRLASDLVAIPRIGALDRLAIGGARQVIDDGIEQRLHALVLERGPAQYRVELAAHHRLADQPLDRRLVGLVAVEVFGHYLVIEVGARFDQLDAVLGRLLFHVGRDFLVVEIGAERLVVPRDRLHANEIDDAPKGRLDAERKLQANGLGAHAIHELVDAAEEIGADLVHLVGEHDTRHIVFVGLAPHGLGLRLDALVAVEHAYGAVQHAERALHFDREVDVAGRIDDIQPLVAPETGRRGGRDGDAALLLLLHPVHGGRAIMDLADLVALAGVIEDSLRSRGLPGIDVRHDAEIAVVLDFMNARHCKVS